MENIIQILSHELGQAESDIKNVIQLLDDGNTVPFIARYRKEMHGSMDDQTIRVLADRLAYLRNLDEKRADIRASIEAQGKLTAELDNALAAAQTLAALDDLYRPYRPKRRTRASIARDKGLAPLADALLSARRPSPSMDELAAPFIASAHGVENTDDALAGAFDIIAENIADDADIRACMRRLIHRTGVITTAGTDRQDTVYQMYHDFSEPVTKLQSHRVLAINRGEKEGKLKVSLTVDDTQALVTLNRSVLHPQNPFCAALREACADAWKRLLFPSLERELRSELTDTANGQAIRTFALNLRPLLMQPPIKNRVTLGFDPGYRNGCKLAVVDGTGKVLDTAVIYPTQPFHKVAEAKRQLTQLCRRHNVTCIAIGNGTASRESEQLVAEFIREYGGDIAYTVVSEAGASVYSASKLAAEEFPDFPSCLKQARRSILHQNWLQKNFLILTLTFGQPSPLHGACRIRWQSLSKLTRRQSESVSISTICPKPV